jgi:hypothetical protein
MVVKRTMRGLVATSVILVALVFSASALAGKPPAYQGKAGSTQGLVQKGASTKPTNLGTTKTVGQLPFTGIDLAVFAAGAAALIAAGVSFRRLGRRSS